MQVYSWMDPPSLLAFSRTSKKFREAFLSPRMEQIWRVSLKSCECLLNAATTSTIDRLCAAIPAPVIAGLVYDQHCYVSRPRSSCSPFVTDVLLFTLRKSSALRQIEGREVRPSVLGAPCHLLRSLLPTGNNHEGPLHVSA